MSAADETRNALALVAEPKEQKTIRDLLVRMEPEIAKVLPRALEPERFSRVVLTELRRNPALYECKPESLLAAMMLSAQLGLEPGPLGHVYLVPFKREVTWILGYRGMVELARRSGELRDIVARTVYEGDGFEYEFGLRERLAHRPTEPDDRGLPRCYYGVARFRGGGHLLSVLYPADVEAHRKRSPAGAKGLGPWASDYEAMARKTCIRVMAPYLPLGLPAARALAYDELPILPDEERPLEPALPVADE